ncbi:3-oxoacyl-[acyl-carrier protein] reductase [Geomicrobium sp. JCM 19037]|nr:3-oxoacyl-[acyl-carrier protein] reductase [Geomicrobium sp. JCM 19037]
MPLDLSCENSIETFAEEVKRYTDHLDVLVNNAGISIPAPLMDLETDSWDRVLSTNVRGPFLLSKQLVPLLQKQAGSIVHVGSMAGHEAYPGMGLIARVRQH